MKEWGKLMYRCKDCRKEFENPISKTMTYEDYYGVYDLFNNSKGHITIQSCPYCSSEDLEEIDNFDDSFRKNEAD